MLTKIIDKTREYATLVMFKHTIFSLSFGLVSLLLATGGEIPGIFKLSLIVVALLAARTGANAINRVIDAEIDILNPRTATRQIPMGKMTKREACLFAIVCFVIMVMSAWLINPLCGALSPIALLLMWGYSYTKRFTWLCHLILGVTCGLAPLGAWLAVTGSFGGLTAVFNALSQFNFIEGWTYFVYALKYEHTIFIPIALFVANAAWVAGFDIIYATQDFEHDRTNGICSIPARWGIKGALYLSSGLHGVAVIALLIAGVLSPSLGVLYVIAIITIGTLLIYEHLIVAPDNLTRVTIASYHVNEIVGILFLVFSMIDILVF